MVHGRTLRNNTSSLFSINGWNFTLIKTFPNELQHKYLHLNISTSKVGLDTKMKDPHDLTLVNVEQYTTSKTKI